MPIFGVSPNAIGLRLSRARTQLKEEMIGKISEVMRTKRLPVSFTFRIVEMVKRITIHSKPSVPWLSWGALLTAALYLQIFSLGSSQMTFGPYTYILIYMGIWIMTQDFCQYNINNNGLLTNTEKAKINAQSGGSKEVILGSSEQNQTNQSNNTNQAIASSSSKIEMQTVSGKVLKDDKPAANAQVTIYLYGTPNKYEGVTKKTVLSKSRLQKPMIS